MTRPTASDRPLLGILFMLGFCVLAPLGDAIAKLLGGVIPTAQLVAFRFAIQAAILVPLVLLTGRSLRLPARVMLFTALRTILHIVGIGAMFAALRYLPLADAVAIAFVMPFVLLLLAWLFLGEEVGPRRLGAAAVGFAGTLMVVQPSFAEVGAPALLPLLVAVAFALFMLVTRVIARAADAITLQAVSGAMAVAILMPLIAVGEASGIAAIDPVAPAGSAWWLIGLLGVLGTVAHLLMTWSLRFAPSATLAPMQYLEIPVATFVGWLIFSDLPDGLAAAGILVTVAAGLYVIHRERVGAARSRPEPRRAPPAA